MTRILVPAALLTAALALASCGSPASTPGPTNVNPVASIAISFMVEGVPGPVDLGDDVEVIATSIDRDPGDVLTHEWDWGDGSAHSAGFASTHRYTSAGTYTITLTTRDNRGGSGVRSVSIEVAPAPANAAAFVGFYLPRSVQKRPVEVGVTPQVVTFDGGTQMTLATDSVVDAGGNVYTGPVVVSGTEVRSKADMVKLKNYPVMRDATGDFTLESGGSFKFDLATPGGAPLDVNKGRGVPIRIPSTRYLDSAMQLFTDQPCAAVGGIPCPPAPAATSSVNWSPAPNQGNFTSTPYTATSAPTYDFTVFNKGWVGTNKFWGKTHNGNTLHVRFDPINDANTIVFLSPKNVHTVIPLYTTDGANGRKSFDTLPVDLDADLVAITFNAGKLYLAKTNLRISDPDSTFNLTLRQVTSAELAANLRLLY